MINIKYFVLAGLIAITSDALVSGQVIRAPQSVPQPTIPTYTEVDAAGLIEQRLRGKRPTVTRTVISETCSVAQWRSPASDVVSVEQPTLFGSSPLVGMLAYVITGIASPNLFGHDLLSSVYSLLQGREGSGADRPGREPPPRRQCRKVETEMPYEGPRARSLLLDSGSAQIFVGEPARVQVPDIQGEFRFDIPNCTSSAQSLSQSLTYSVRVGDQVMITNGISNTIENSKSVSISVGYSDGWSASGTASRTVTSSKTIMSAHAGTISSDQTVTRQAIIPLIAPKMSRVIALVSTSQSSFEVPFTIKMRVTGRLNPTSQYPDAPIDTELTPEERTMEIRGFIRNFYAGDVVFKPTQVRLKRADCRAGSAPTLTINPAGNTPRSIRIG